MRKIIKALFICILLVLSLSFSVSAESEDYEYCYTDKGTEVKYYGTNEAIKIPKTYQEKEVECRACWVSFYAGDVDDYVNKSQMMNQLNGIMDTMESYNLNTMIFHIRTHNDAYYDTDLCPINSAVSSCDFDEWDYLEWLISECHKRGMEFHAWLNPYRISSVETTKEQIKAKYANFPNNPAYNLDNVLMSDDGAILDPGIPEVREYIIDVCMEICEKYDIDAIHFDDYFYISDVDDSKTREKYNYSKLSVSDFRRKQVDIFIDDLHLKLESFNKANGKAIQLGISPSGIYDNGSYVSPSRYKYDSNGNLTYPLYSGSAGYSHYTSPLYSDTKKWIDNDWIDYIIPQLYNSIATNAASFPTVATWWNGVVKYKNCKLYLGIGLYMMNGTNKGSWTYNENELAQQLRFAQSLENVDGISLYQYKTIYRNQDSTNLKTLKKYWAHKAINPEVTRYASNFDTNIEVNNLEIHEGSDGYVSLTWTNNDQASRYLIYRLDEENSELIGIVGNSATEEYTYFYDIYDISKNQSYSIIPLNKVNNRCLTSNINKANFSPFNYKIGSLEICVSSVKKIGAVINLSFSAPVLNIGTSGKYKVLISLDENFENIIYESDYVSFDETNTKIIKYNMNDKGMNEYFKVIVLNEFGSFESNVAVSNFIDTPITALSYVTSYVDDFFDSLFK